MSEITQEMIDKAIKDCFWRIEIEGISICKGMLTPCQRTIENGNCDTLKRLYQGGDAE